MSTTGVSCSMTLRSSPAGQVRVRHDVRYSSVCSHSAAWSTPMFLTNTRWPPRYAPPKIVPYAVQPSAAAEAPVARLAGQQRPDVETVADRLNEHVEEADALRLALQDVPVGNAGDGGGRAR